MVSATFEGMDWNGIRYVLESVANGITISDARKGDLPLIYANPAFERMTGYQIAEVIGKNCRFLQGETENQPGLMSVRKALLERKDTRSVLKNFKKDGTPFWNELYISPIRNQGGEITHYLGIQNDISERIALEERLEYMAGHDMLSGLPTRALFMDRIVQAIHRAKREGQSLALLFLDVDNFKYVNDTFGHEAGDALLKVIGHRLAVDTRDHETAARLGGDEFAVVLEGIEKEKDIAKVIRRLTDRLHQPLLLVEQIFRPSISIGVAMYPHDGTSPEDLLRVADMAMYAEKALRKIAEKHNPFIAERSDLTSARMAVKRGYGYVRREGSAQNCGETQPVYRRAL